MWQVPPWRKRDEVAALRAEIANLLEKRDETIYRLTCDLKAEATARVHAEQRFALLLKAHAAAIRELQNGLSEVGKRTEGIETRLEILAARPQSITEFADLLRRCADSLAIDSGA